MSELPEALQKLQAEHRADITIGDHTYTLERVSLYDCILAGEDIPLSILDEIEKDREDDDDGPTPEERFAKLKENRRRQDWVVRAGVKAIDGEAVVIGTDVALSSLFSDAERRRIADWCLWQDGQGKA